MTWSAIRPWLGSVVRLVLGGVWIYAAWSKLPDPRGFTETVRAYQATPEWLSQAIGYGLPVLEICLGLLLVFGVITRAAAIASAPLLLVFIIGIAQASARGIKLDCGCFGGGGTTLGATAYTVDILRDVGLIVLAAYLIIWPMTRISVDEFLARNDRVVLPSAKRMRSSQGQRKYNAMLESRKKAAHERSLYLTSALGVVVVLVSVIGIGVQANRAKIQGSLTAAHASVQNGVVVGKSAAPVTVDVFEDFQCPVCEQFETATSADVNAKIKAGTIKVQYHTMAFLDSSSSGNRYSSRAANAALCASDISTAMFQKYHGILFGKDTKGNKVQPAEGGNGRTDTQLVDYGKQAGIKNTKTSQQLTTFTSCVDSEQHKPLVEAITENASKRGVNATPTVMVDGKKIANPSKQTLDSAIAAALKKKGGAKTSGAPTSPAATPSSTKTASAKPTP